MHAHFSICNKNEITIVEDTSPTNLPAEEGLIANNTELPLSYPNCDLNIWLRSCESETVAPLEGVVTGEIPVWVRGSLYRNGPGKQRYEKQHVNHLFDAAGLLHK